MNEKRDELVRDTSEQKSDPDALRVQDAPLKQQGDKLEADTTDRRPEGKRSADRSKDT